MSDGFSIQYADGSGASGDYFTDDFTIGDITVSDLQMGLADKTAIGSGILGIGFELNEAAETIYSNLVSVMVDQSKISTMAYSLYLNDYDSSTGSILFGGVDTEKFIGDLMTVPILADAQSNNYSSFTVGLSGLSFTFGNGTSYNQSLSTEDNSVKSILDSGTTLSYLPAAIAIPLFDAVGAYQDSSSIQSTGLALVDCALDVEFSFTINDNVTITVPKDELVIDALQGYPLSSDVPFSNACLFGIQNIGDSSSSSSSARTADYALLGDSFLRSAYVVYDLSNMQIGLAPANLNSTASNIQELKGGESNLPAFSGVASQSSGGDSSGTSTAGTSSATGTSSSGTGAGTFWALSSVRTSFGRDDATSVADASSSFALQTSSCASLPTAGLALGTANSSSGAWPGGNASSAVVAAAASSTASATSSLLVGNTHVYGFPNTTAYTIATITTTTHWGLASAKVSHPTTTSHTNDSAASSSSTGTSAAMGQGSPDLGGLLAVVGVSLAFAMSGSLLFGL